MEKREISLKCDFRSFRGKKATSGQSLLSCESAAGILKGSPTTSNLWEYRISSPDVTGIKTRKDTRKYEVALEDSSERKTHMVDWRKI